MRNYKVNHNNSTNGNSHDRMLTSRELAEILHVHINTVRRWSDLGLIYTYRVGMRGDRRYNLQDIEQFLKRGRALYQRNAENPIN